jgi:hypothetical protein
MHGGEPHCRLWFLLALRDDHSGGGRGMREHCAEEYEGNRHAAYGG